MKNLLKVAALAICMSATSVWAETPADPLEMIPTPAASPTQLGPDTVAVANMINNPVVQECFAEAEARYRGQLVLTEIQHTGNPSHLSYEVKSILLVGGDVVVGYVEFDITRTVGFPWGPFYDCKMRPGFLAE